jgi:short subunit fatty acids transporter
MIIIIISGVIIFWALAPKRAEACRGIDVVAPHILEVVKKEEEEAKAAKPEKVTIADKLENSKILAGINSYFCYYSYGLVVWSLRVYERSKPKLFKLLLYPDRFSVIHESYSLHACYC